MSAGSMGYVVMMAGISHILSLLFVGFVVAFFGPSMFKIVHVANTGVEKKRLTFLGSLVTAAISTGIFAGLIYGELGSKEFRDTFG